MSFFCAICTIFCFTIISKYLFDLLTLTDTYELLRCNATLAGLRFATVGAEQTSTGRLAPANIRNPLIYCVNRYGLRFTTVGAEQTSTGCLAPHVWRVPSSKGISCKHECLFDLLTLVSKTQPYDCHMIAYHVFILLRNNQQICPLIFFS